MVSNLEEALNKISAMNVPYKPLHVNMCICCRPYLQLIAFICHTYLPYLVYLVCAIIVYLELL